MSDYKFKNTICSITELSDPASIPEIAIALSHKGFLTQDIGILTNGRGLKSEIMSPDEELLKKICAQGLCIHGELVRYVPCYDDSLWIKFRNIPLEAGDAELAGILQDHGGKIIDIQRQYIKVQGIQKLAYLNLIILVIFLSTQWSNIDFTL